MIKYYKNYFIAVISLLTLILAGCQSASRTETVNTSTTSSLGTQWGDGIESHVQGVSLKRINSKPLDIITIHYSNQSYKGKVVSETMLNHSKIGIAIIDDYGNKWPLVKQYNDVKLQGKLGQSYQLFYHNYSSNTYEVIATVDGLDVINGKAGSLSNNGYILRPYDILIIKGFRKSDSEVAAFTFSNSTDAYANHTDEGSAKNIGIIGTAIFQLEDDNQHYQKVNPNAFPADNNDSSYAKPPKY